MINGTKNKDKYAYRGAILARIGIDGKYVFLAPLGTIGLLITWGGICRLMAPVEGIGGTSLRGVRRALESARRLHRPALVLLFPLMLRLCVNS